MRSRLCCHSKWKVRLVEVESAMHRYAAQRFPANREDREAAPSASSRMHTRGYRLIVRLCPSGDSQHACSGGERDTVSYRPYPLGYSVGSATWGLTGLASVSVCQQYANTVYHRLLEPMVQPRYNVSDAETIMSRPSTYGGITHLWQRQQWGRLPTGPPFRGVEVRLLV